MLRFAPVFAALFVLSVGPACAQEVELEATGDGQIVFSMPSGNIGCIYTPEGGTEFYEPEDGGPELSCDRVAPSYVNIRLGMEGAIRTDDPGEQGCCGMDQVLEYGSAATLGPFMCASSTRGLACETEDGAHGFFLSRARISVE